MESAPATSVRSAKDLAARTAFKLVEGALDDLRDAALWKANEEKSSSPWWQRSAQARDDVVDLLSAAHASEAERGIDNADTLYLLDMAEDLLGQFGFHESADKNEFTTAAHRAVALINGAKHVPGPRPSIVAMTLMDQALVLIDSLTDYLMGGVAPAAK